MIDPRVKAKVMQRYNALRQQRNDELLRRKQEIGEEIPEIDEIDREITRIMLKIAREALGTKDEQIIARRMNTAKERTDALITRQKALLRDHGYPEDYFEMRPRCEICEDYGYVDADPCICFTEECRKEEIRELSRVLDIEGQNFDSFDSELYSDRVSDGEQGMSPRDNIEAFMDYFSEYARHFGADSKSLLFYGGTGLGKTFMSSCIAKEVVGRGFSVVYDTAISIFTALEREKFRSISEEERRDLKRYEVCDLLIIDDLGTEMVTDFIRTALYQLINTRMNSGRPMIINTNLSPKEIGTRYSSQIESRIRNTFECFRFFGRDVRQVKKENEQYR